MQLVLFVCLFAAAFAAPDECPDNSHYDSCGTACPLTCENYSNPPKICVLMCNPGCHCDEGYVKTEDGRCVLPEQCESPKCPENSHYESCGTACPLTCENYSNPPNVCVLMCNSGCHCDEGYVKTKDGRCVLREQCESSAIADDYKCGVNKEFQECGSACRRQTCNNYNKPPKACPAICVVGCYCKKGYVLTDDDECVLPQNCPEFDKKSCLLEPDGGMCRAFFEGYYYDARLGQCKKFIYGGCDGNKNRFGSEEQCLEKCGDVQVWELDTNVCDLPIKRGLCLAYMPRYAFNKDTGKCEKFIYGGCGGNKNNFDSLEECESRCPARHSALDRPDCDKAADSGLCKAYVPRFYYDQEAGMCKKFIYGGCGGNRNNFATEFECYNKCGALAAPSACRHPKEVGPCRAAFKRFYYNSETNRCEPFTYGGCQGNDNNFNSQEDCENVCINYS